MRYMKLDICKPIKGYIFQTLIFSSPIVAVQHFGNFSHGSIETIVMLYGSITLQLHGDHYESAIEVPFVVLM